MACPALQVVQRSGCPDRLGRIQRRRARIAAALVLALVSALAPGCTTWQAARLYRSGTQALVRGDIERAVDDLERAAVLEPHASEIQNHLGLARLAAGDEPAARRAFARAVELDCDNAAARRNLDLLQASTPTSEIGSVSTGPGENR